MIYYRLLSLITVEELEWLRDLGVLVDLRQETQDITIYSGHRCTIMGASYVLLGAYTDEQDTLLTLKYGDALVLESYHGES